MISVAKKNLLMIPGPVEVPQRVMDVMRRPLVDHRSPEFRELYQDIIKKARYLFQTKGDIFILTCSGTGGVEAAICNIVQPDDKVIVPVFGVFSQRVSQAVKAYGGRSIEIQVELGKAPLPDQIEEVADREGAIKMIALVCNETSTGVKVPDLAEVSRIAEEHDALMFADAISILGGDELPVDDWNIDLCVTASQKCIAAPPGLALISLSEKAWEAIRRNPQRPHYFDLVKYEEYLSEKNETPFTPSLPIFYALDEALSIVREEGLEKRFERHRRCSSALYSAAKEMDIQIFPDEKFWSPTIIALKVPEGIEDKTLRRTMREQGVVISGGMGKLRGSVVRIGSMGIVSEKEIEMTISALGNALVKLGKQVSVEQGLSAARQVFSS
jgi:aspartate aminotransferase-like enzyme